MRTFVHAIVILTALISSTASSESTTEVFEDDDAVSHNVWTSSQPGGENADDGEGQCVWYGTEATNRLNIVYNGPAKPLDDDLATRDLQLVCPELYENLGIDDSDDDGN